MNRNLAAPILAAVLALAAGCAAPAEGRRAPAVRGEGWLLLEGREASAVIEGKWGLVVFFRPHLPACNEGIGRVRDLVHEYGPRGLTAVGVTPDGPEEAKAFVLRHQLPFPVLPAARPVLDAWGLPDMWGNRIYLVNPGGVVLAQDDLPATRRLLEKWMPK